MSAEKVNIEQLHVSCEITVKDALKRLDQGGERILFVVDEDKVLKGVIADGDLRRALLSGVTLDSTIEPHYNRSPVVVGINEAGDDRIRELLVSHRIEAIPVVDTNGHVTDLVTWDRIGLGNYVHQEVHGHIDVPVVVMAGGKGTRLAPFTNILPKPLVPIGERTILECIFDGFGLYGVSTFILVLNYKGEMIRAYLEGTEHPYNVQYVWEKEFFGTASGIKLATNMLPDTFIVTNCDILVKADYADVIDFHKKSGAALTVLSSIQHHVIPYGVVEFKDGGELTGIVEKPEYTFSINTGAYVVNKRCLSLIPDGVLFHMTHLIEAVRLAGEKVFTYPVNEKDYVDVGQWEEYARATKTIQGHTL